MVLFYPLFLINFPIVHQVHLKEQIKEILYWWAAASAVILYYAASTLESY